MEEWIALGQKLLCSYYRIKNIFEEDGYRGPLRIAVSLKAFLVTLHSLTIELLADQICGPYIDKEETEAPEPRPETLFESSV